MITAEVTIHLKKGVADPEGKNTKKTLELLGFDKVHDVKSAKVFEIELDIDDRDEAQNKVSEMCNKLLANPVIHNYSISIK
jgi:phosphoribosylformylglycinamidine synthase